MLKLLGACASVVGLIGCVDAESSGSPGLSSSGPPGAAPMTQDPWPDAAMNPPPAMDEPPASAPLPAVPFHTSTRFVVDRDGQRFKLAGVSWYGAESATLTPDGLDVARLDD